jgi:hypothetical protein
MHWAAEIIPDDVGGIGRGFFDVDVDRDVRGVDEATLLDDVSSREMGPVDGETIERAVGFVLHANDRIVDFFHETESFLLVHGYIPGILQKPVKEGPRQGTGVLTTRALYRKEGGQGWCYTGLVDLSPLYPPYWWGDKMGLFERV